MTSSRLMLRFCCATFFRDGFGAGFGGGVFGFAAIAFRSFSIFAAMVILSFFAFTLIFMILAKRTRSSFVYSFAIFLPIRNVLPVPVRRYSFPLFLNAATCAFSLPTFLIIAHKSSFFVVFLMFTIPSLFAMSYNCGSEYRSHRR